MKLDHPFTAALATLPCPGGNGYHPRLLGVANIGIRAGIPPAEVAAALRAHTPSGGRRVPDREILDAVNKAAQGRVGTAYRGERPRWRPPRPTVTAKPADAAAFVAARVAEGVGCGEADIWEASPVRIEAPAAADAVTLLEALYAREDVLFIGDTYGRTVKTVGEWIGRFRGGCVLPPHIIPNPVTGELGMTKDGRPSYRADTCVKAFRFAVAEFDAMSREDQFHFWWAVDLPVCALIDSGGKSLHAWIRIDGVRNGAEWESQVEGLLFGRWLIPMGCDPACRNEARLSRLPGHYRAEKGRWQRLMYLAPEGRPIHAGA
ncbi:MAG: hypothetical protein K8T26_08285 [Lentisphaerae bacterium]|nr:hypothetical protein [Lentisphaerota bacterium]